MYREKKVSIPSAESHEKCLVNAYRLGIPGKLGGWSMPGSCGKELPGGFPEPPGAGVGVDVDVEKVVVVVSLLIPLPLPEEVPMVAVPLPAPDPIPLPPPKDVPEVPAPVSLPDKGGIVVPVPLLPEAPPPPPPPSPDVILLKVEPNLVRSEPVSQPEKEPTACFPHVSMIPLRLRPLSRTCVNPLPAMLANVPARLVNRLLCAMGAAAMARTSIPRDFRVVSMAATSIPRASSAVLRAVMRAASAASAASALGTGAARMVAGRTKTAKTFVNRIVALVRRCGWVSMIFRG